MSLPIADLNLRLAEINTDNSAKWLKLRTTQAQLTPPPSPELTGRGIIICGGGRYTLSAWVTCNVLRHLGCDLPIQVWHLGPEEIPEPMHAAFASINTQTVDARALLERYPHPRLNGWEVKAYALLHCPFREVLLLDADNIPLQNPTKFFDHPEYLRTGAMFWPDRGRWVPEADIWKLSGIPYRDECEFESGQMFIDKQRCWHAVVLSDLINQDSGFWYSHIHGDKDTFRLAWRALEMDYTMAPHLSDAPWPFFYQKDFDGTYLFHHGHKWTTPANSNDPCQPGTPAYCVADACFAAADRYDVILSGAADAPPVILPAATPVPPGATAVLQFADHNMEGLVNLASPVHEALCKQYGYDYILTREPKTDRHPVWERVRLLKETFEKGYEYVAWLDMDALWLGKGPLLDVWQGAQPAAMFAGTWHGFRGVGTEAGHWYDHMNLGSFFVRKSPQLLAFLDKWWNESDEGHPWREQHSFNKLRAAQPDIAYIVGHEWNSVMWEPAYRTGRPKIVAWHGKPELVIGGMTPYVEEFKRTHSLST